MKLQCECGKFRAELTAFPKNTPGRLVCYCDDCQAFLHCLNRADLLDQNGGTEIIPAYPGDTKFLSGVEQLTCLRLSTTGMFRFSTSCCNTPVANVRAKQPWFGFFRSVYHDTDKLNQTLGPVRSRIMGKFAKGVPPKGTPKKMNLRGLFFILPFVLKGIALKKIKPSPFFGEDGITPVATSHILNSEELSAARTNARAAS